MTQLPKKLLVIGAVSALCACDGPASNTTANSSTPSSSTLSLASKRAGRIFRRTRPTPKPSPSPTPSPPPSPSPSPTATPSPSPSVTPSPSSAPLASYGYDITAYHVTVANAASLQKALDTYHSVRLDNGDYSKALAKITIQSGYKIFGLANSSRLPPIVVAPGTQKALLSSISTSSVTFPASSISTKDNEFLRVWAEGDLTNAVLENNLFVDWWGVFNFNTSTSGYFRNNRFIRTHGQLNNDTFIDWTGNSVTPSYGNVFLFYNFLATGGNPSSLNNLTDLTMVGVDAESWDWNGFGTGGAVIQTNNNFGDLRMWATEGGNWSGKTQTPFFNVGAKRFLAINHLNYTDLPSPVLQSNVQSAVVLNIPSQPITQKNPATLVYKGWSPDTAPTQLSAAALQSLRDTMIGMTQGRQGQPWEKPTFEAIPDPAGPDWNKNLAAQPDSSSYIQGLINSQGIALLPAGTYYISKPIQLKDTQGLIGAGMDKTVIIAKTSTMDMIVGSDKLTDTTSISLILSDLTLQGGANGIHMGASGSGKGAAYNYSFVSHVTLRNMTNAGIWADQIYGVDNNLFDRVNFVNNATGIKQTPMVDFYQDAPGVAYMDKNVYYQCQFIGNKLAIDMRAHRPDNLNMWVNNLFQNNTDGVAIFENNYDPIFANSVFINNGGPAVIQADGTNQNPSCVSCTFQAGANGKAIVNGTMSFEGSSFSQSGGNAVISLGGDLSLYNSTASDMAMGSPGLGFFFNNYLPKNSPYSVEGAIKNGSTLKVLLPTAITAPPQPQLLFGGPMAIPY